MSSNAGDDGCSGAADSADRDTLRSVLAINLAQSIIGGLVGLLASSTALMGAALDNLADAGVYGVSLYAVGKPVRYKARAARISGWLLIVLSAGLLVEVLRRFFGGADPVGLAMMLMAAINAGINLVCLSLLRRRRGRGVHFEASWIFTSNDTLVNVGIVVSGALVLWLDSPLPDLVIGLLVIAVAFRGGREILGKARVSGARNSGRN